MKKTIIIAFLLVSVAALFATDVKVTGDFRIGYAWSNTKNSVTVVTGSESVTTTATSKHGAFDFEFGSEFYFINTSFGSSVDFSAGMEIAFITGLGSHTVTSGNKTTKYAFANAGLFAGPVFRLTINDSIIATLTCGFTGGTQISNDMDIEVSAGYKLKSGLIMGLAARFGTGTGYHQIVAGVSKDF